MYRLIGGAFAHLWVIALIVAPATAQDYPFTGVINADDVNVRAGSGQNYYAVTQLHRGKLVTVHDELYGWYRISPPAGTYSYISKSFVKLEDDGQTGTVTGQRVRVRAPSPQGPGNPNASYKIQVTLDDGAKVRVLGDAGTFYMIEPPTDAHLFVAKEYVDAATPQQIAAAKAAEQQPAQAAPQTQAPAPQAELAAPAAAEAPAAPPSPAPAPQTQALALPTAATTTAATATDAAPPVPTISVGGTLSVKLQPDGSATIRGVKYTFDQYIATVKQLVGRGSQFRVFIEAAGVDQEITERYRSSTMLAGVESLMVFAAVPTPAPTAPASAPDPAPLATTVEPQPQPTVPTPPAPPTPTPVATVAAPAPAPEVASAPPSVVQTPPAPAAQPSSQSTLESADTAPTVTASGTTSTVDTAAGTTPEPAPVVTAPPAPQPPVVEPSLTSAEPAPQAAAPPLGREPGAERQPPAVIAPPQPQEPIITPENAEPPVASSVEPPSATSATAPNPAPPATLSAQDTPRPVVWEGPPQPNRILIGRQPRPPAAVEPPPSAPPNPPIAEALAELESRFQAMSSQPLEQQPLAPLRREYQQLLAQPYVSTAERALIQARIDALATREKLQQSLLEVAEVRSQLDEAQRASVPVIDADPKVYNAVGRLSASTLYTGQRLPLLYRLVDPMTNMTTAYIRPKRGARLHALLGQTVGVVGQREYDSALRLNIITPDSIDALAPAQASADNAP